MGTQDRHAPTGLQSGRGPQQARTDRSLGLDDPHVPPQGAGRDRFSAEDVLEEILVVLGPERISRAAVAWAILLEPHDLQDGERIAGELGLDHAVDHTRQEPATTVWSGAYLGVDVQVQSALRSATGSAR